MSQSDQKTEQPAYQALALSATRAKIPAFLVSSLAAGLLVFVFCSCTALVVFFFATQAQQTQALEDLRTRGELLATLLPARARSEITAGAPPNSPAHKEILDLFHRSQKFSPLPQNLFLGRYQNERFSILLGTPDALDSDTPAAVLARLNRPEASAEREAMAAGKPWMDQSSGPAAGPPDIGQLVPLNAAKNGPADFLYIETRTAPLAQYLARTRDVRDLCILASAGIGIAFALLVFFTRHRSFYRRTLAVNKVAESEALFRSTYESSPVAMYLVNTTGRIIRANRAFCQFLGYNEGEITKLLTPNYLPDANQDPASSNPLPGEQVERRFRRQDGRLVWGLVSSAIVRDAEGNFSHYLVQVVDITERKTVEDTLKVSEERLAIAAGAGEVGMWDCDVKSGTVVWNSVMHEIHQTDPATFVPTFALQRQFIVEDDQQAFSQAFGQGLKTNQPYSGEYRLVTKTGTTRHVKTSATFLRDESGKSVRAVGTTIDITVEKAEAEELRRTREAALAADRAKSEFLSMMSHEIRTPLNGVLGFASLLKGTPLNPEQLGYIETMESSGGRLVNLVNDILDLSQLEVGKIQIEPSTFPARPFLEKLHAEYAALALEKNLSYELIIEDPVPQTLHTDPNRLRQILGNFLSNAVKFTETGRVRLRAKATHEGATWEWLFTVEDTGPGIDPEELPKLFQPFHQLDSSNSRIHGGTGLGLAISRRMTKRLGGQLVLQSEVGYGSIFGLILPSLADAPPCSSTPVPASSENPGGRLASKRVLVVEDNAVNRKLCGLQLKRLGCVVSYAETGEEAISKLNTEQFDAILMDVQLPKLDGYDTTRLIRASEKDGVSQAIIALTANAMPEDRRRCLDAGMNDFLSKPLQFETLAETLGRWVR